MGSEPKSIPWGQKLRIYSDGGSRDNPGPSAFCVMFFDEDDNVLYEYSEYLGKMTNNQAEMSGILHAVDKAISCTRGEIDIYSDSELAICWMNGTYRVKSQNIKPLFDKIQILIGGSRYASVRFIHVRRENRYIQMCDQRVNQCLDKAMGK